jgi:hypothetical protein
LQGEVRWGIRIAAETSPNPSLVRRGVKEVGLGKERGKGVEDSSE